MAGVGWFVTLEGIEQGPLDPAQVKEMVQAGLIGPMTPIRRADLDRAVAAGQVKGLLPPEMRAASGMDAPASISGPQQPGSASVALTDSGAQRVRGSVPSTRRMAIVTPEPDSHPVPRAEHAAEADTEAPDDQVDEPAAIDAGIEARAGFGPRLIARMVDTALLFVVFVFVAGGGMLVGGAIVDGTLAQIETERLNTVADYEMPSYQSWAEDGSLQPKPELPAMPSPIEGESEATYAKRMESYRAEHTAISEQRKVYNWRAQRFEEVDRPRMLAAEKQGTAMALIGLALAILVMAVYSPLSEAAMGATVGKKVMGLAVVDADYRKLRPGAAILRHVLRLIPLGQLRALSADRRALHDLWSGTQVVPRDQMRGGRKRGGGKRSRRGGEPETGTGRKRAGGRRRR